MKGAPAFRLAHAQAHPAAPRYDTLHVRELTLRFPVGGAAGGTALVQPLAGDKPAGDAYPVALVDLADAPIDALLDWLRGRLPVDQADPVSAAPVVVERVELPVAERPAAPERPVREEGDAVRPGDGLGRLG